MLALPTLKLVTTGRVGKITKASKAGHNLPSSGRTRAGTRASRVGEREGAKAKYPNGSHYSPAPRDLRSRNSQTGAVRSQVTPPSASINPFEKIHAIRDYTAAVHLDFSGQGSIGNECRFHPGR